MSVRGCGRPVDDFAGFKPAKATTEPAGENSNPIIQRMIVRTIQAQKKNALFGVLFMSVRGFEPRTT